MSEFSKRELGRIAGKSTDTVIRFYNTPERCSEKTRQSITKAMQSKIIAMLAEYLEHMKGSDITLLLGQIEAIIEQVKEGEYDALQGIADLKALEDMVKEAMKEIKPHAVNAISLYGKGEEPSINGYKIEPMQSVSYGYTLPPVIEAYKTDLSEYQKACRENHKEFVTCEGELLPVHKAVRYSTSTVKLTKIKK